MTWESPLARLLFDHKLKLDWLPFREGNALRSLWIKRNGGDTGFEELGADMRDYFARIDEEYGLRLE